MTIQLVNQTRGLLPLIEQTVGCVSVSVSRQYHWKRPCKTKRQAIYEKKHLEMYLSKTTKRTCHGSCRRIGCVHLGTVHILRQPPEGGRQMLTIADEGGEGGHPKADHC